MPATVSPVHLGPVNPLPDPMEYANRAKQILGGAIPGLDNLAQGASSVVGNLLGGMPSAGPVQRENAYFGTQTGMPGSDFVRNRGFDLYGQKAEQYKQRGFDDFLALLRGTSGTIAPTTGEQLNNSQFDRNLQQRQIENNQNVGQFNANYNKRDEFDTNVWRSSDNGDLYNKAGQKIRNDPNFARKRSVLFG